MAEYISKQDVIDYLNGYLHSIGECGADSLLFDRGQRRALINSIQDILAVKAADVQPVNQWISVDDRLPDKFEYVLCYCKTTTGEGNEFMFGAYHNDTWWLKTCRTYATLEQPQMRVIYWMSLPEPPKDGDTNG